MADTVIILGAGLAGLSAAAHFEGDSEVFEKENYVGGHCRSKQVDGFHFDEGAHVFFGRDECSQ
ncbi:MAG: NAD(P)-binding protein, partial [Candidatus Binatia bacterium]